MKPLIVILGALAAGFVGGVVGARVAGTGEKDPISVIRARSFELVNESGQTISFWGVDNIQQAVLAFGSRGFALNEVHPNGIPAGLRNPDNQLTAFGLQGNDGPILKMSAANGKRRVSLLLSQDGKPALTMADETGPRVSLGIEQSDTPGPQDNNWSLLFAPEMARIGMGTEKQGEETYVRGVFFVNRNKAKYPDQWPK
jgi:hypothetical protein